MFPYHGECCDGALNLKEPALWLRTLIYIDRISWPKLSPFVLETVLWISLALTGNTFQKEKEGIWIQSPVFESWLGYIAVGWPLSDVQCPEPPFIHL